MPTYFVITLASFCALFCADRAIARYHAGLTDAGNLWVVAAAFDLFILLSTLYSVYREKERSSER